MSKIGSVLIVGGGIGGTQAALDLSESGFKVYLLEQTTSIGGVMAQLDKTFPTNDCAMCIVSPKLVEAGRHPNIDLLINAEIQYLDGEAGNFTLKILQKSLYLDPEKCTGCGVCGQECPVEALDGFNENLSNYKATYVKYPQAVPLVYAINRDKCIGCGICEAVCKAHAIDYKQEDREISLNVGSIILALGFDEYVPEQAYPYGYKKYPNVTTSIEFERILSASGPYGGLVLRPSDGEIPRKLAFLQCVGSRDYHHAQPYCSSVCCMYTAKEAVIAKEHQPQVNPTIFSMDIRAYGKDFDKYIVRAQDEYGIRYIRSRISSIEETKDNHNLILTYETEDGKIFSEEYNMVVLGVGLNPPNSAKLLSEKLGVELNEYGFAKTFPFSPSKTSKPGIFVCGAFAAPKDIPETVVQASASAAHANILLAPERGSLVTKKVYPEEKYVKGERPRIGVFVCHCGINIGGVVDVPAVKKYASTLLNVEYSGENLYTCSADTQTKMKEIIEEYNLNRVIVASCTPRTHEPLFQETIREAGLNRYLFEMANIRDQCSWVHMHLPEAATEKSKDLVRMAVSKANKIEPLQRTLLKMTHKALVIGGGISGLTAALGFAQQGYETNLIEKEPVLGGFANQIYETIETYPVQTYLTDLIAKSKQQEHLTVHTGTRILDLQGYVGNFNVIVENSAQEQLELESGVIVVATGAVPYTPTEYLNGTVKSVVTQVEFEESLFTNTFDTTLNHIVMIQCVGSRNEEHPYCSRVCCAEAIKNAIKLKELHPDKEIFILYRDIRTYGFKEQYYRKARELGVVFLRFDENDPPSITQSDTSAELAVNVNTKQIGDLQILADLVVLSGGIEALSTNSDLAKMLKVPINDDKFFLEAHVKLRPVDFATEGVFVCGMAHSPKSIDESIMQANAVVSRASTLLSKEEIEAEGVVAVIDPMKCSGCTLCIDTCAYNAITMDEEKNIAVINSALCKGCGACTANCRGMAIDLLGFTNEQIYLVIEERDG
jgi:heterodisulfide reductase subunit A